MENKLIRSNQNSDRISDLPEPIRIHILSFLPTRDAIRASILSSIWRASWIYLPNLNFGRYQVRKIRKLRHGIEVDNARRKELKDRKREEFFEFLDRVLQSDFQLNKLDLYVPGYGLALKSRLDYCLERAVVRGVKELILDIAPLENLVYSLPKIVISGSAITKLKLHKCEINSFSLVENGLPCLRELILDLVDLDDGVMESLSMICPNLEILNFRFCYGLTRFLVSGLFKLAKINVQNYEVQIESMKVEAPNLLEFDYIYKFGIDTLADPCKIEVFDCKKLRRLRLHGTELSDDDINRLLEALPILKELELCQCNHLEHVHISSQHLVHLKILLCEALLKIEIDTPYLKTFHYRDNELKSLVSKSAALKLTEASIHLKPKIVGCKCDAGHVKFLAELCDSERLTLIVGPEEELIVPETVRMNFHPPLHGVKNLVVELQASALKHIGVGFVEALLWLAPCLESLTIYNNFIPVSKVLKFKYEKPLEGEKNCGCWNSLAIKCWRHALTEVSLENRRGDEDDTKLAAFFSNARIDGKLVTFVKKEWTDKDKAKSLPPSCLC